MKRQEAYHAGDSFKIPEMTGKYNGGAFRVVGKIFHVSTIDLYSSENVIGVEYETFFRLSWYSILCNTLAKW